MNTDKQPVETYVHPQGARIEVYEDGSIQAWNSEGKRKKTTATATKLRQGHGQWTLQEEEEVIEGGDEEEEEDS